MSNSNASHTNAPPPGSDRFNALTGKIASAILSRFAATQVLPLGSSQPTTTQFKAQLDTYNAAVADSAAAKAIWDGKEAIVKQQAAALKPLIAAFRLIANAAFGATSAILADFGFTPAKVRAPRTSEQKVASVTKARQSRSAKKAAAATLNQTLAAIQASDVSVTSSLTPKVATPSAATAATATAAGPAAAPTPAAPGAGAAQ